MIWVALIIGLVVDYVIAAEMEQIAESKGCEMPKRYFWYSFMCGLPGWLMVVALPNKRIEDLLVAVGNGEEQENNKTLMSSSTVLDVKEVQLSEADGELTISPNVQNLHEKNAKKYSNTTAAVSAERGDIKCSQCGTIQKNNRTVCWKCGSALSAGE